MNCLKNEWGACAGQPDTDSGRKATPEIPLLRKTEYEIIPAGSFAVVRRCAGCGKKTHFVSTGKFRINGNGKKLDVWLIYQCERCRHTFNLTIYERVRLSSIPEKEYLLFLSNDEQLAKSYGQDIRLFQKNRAVIDPGRLTCDFVKLCETHEAIQNHSASTQTLITIENPCELKIRPEKQLAQVLGESVSSVRKRLQEGTLVLVNASPRRVCAALSECGSENRQVPPF